MSICALTVPRETEEFVPLYVTIDGVETVDYEVTLTKGLERPLSWAPAATNSGQTGVVLQDLTKGEWHVWVRLLGTIVEHVDTIRVT